jgi:hypothetical protein
VAVAAVAAKMMGVAVLALISQSKDCGLNYLSNLVPPLRVTLGLGTRFLFK